MRTCHKNLHRALNPQTCFVPCANGAHLEHRSPLLARLQVGDVPWLVSQRLQDLAGLLEGRKKGKGGLIATVPVCPSIAAMTGRAFTAAMRLSIATAQESVLTSRLCADTSRWLSSGLQARDTCMGRAHAPHPVVTSWLVG